ncbi:TPA: DUF86 domain-containing protein [Candidatus Poribacteria bacterium]|nr:DUF86 domain-containing protein [Candidatus Poribacteria bacterium]
MKEREWKLFLEDVLDCIEKIERYTKGIDFGDFTENPMAFDAVIRNLEVIGEACKYIPAGIKESYDKVPWKAIVGLRNIAIHEYFGLDLENIWKIIRVDLPKNKETFRKVLEDE